MPDLKDLWRLVQVMNEIKAWRFTVIMLVALITGLALLSKKHSQAWLLSFRHVGKKRHDNAVLSDTAYLPRCQITRRTPPKPVR